MRRDLGFLRGRICCCCSRFWRLACRFARWRRGRLCGPLWISAREARALPWTRWGRRPQTPFICSGNGIGAEPTSEIHDSARTAKKVGVAHWPLGGVWRLPPFSNHQLANGCRRVRSCPYAPSFVGGERPIGRSRVGGEWSTKRYRDLAVLVCKSYGNRKPEIRPLRKLVAEEVLPVWGVDVA